MCGVVAASIAWERAWDPGGDATYQALGLGQGSPVEKLETERPSGVYEMRELERVALNAESQSPLSVRVVLNHKSNGLAPLL